MFDTVFDGTLCGKWPALPVWLSLLPMADWRGHIDKTPEAIAACTGWPMVLLMEGIKYLCEPDPRSRSKSDDGRRLVLIDPDREWGWRVINIQIYRNKASGKDQVEDGRNAEKVRRYKERKRTLGDTGGNRGTPSNTNSDSDSNIDKSKSAPMAALESEPEAVWGLLIKTQGAEPERTPKVNGALKAAGGWPAIRNRTPHTEPKIKASFCNALRGSA